MTDPIDEIDPAERPALIAKFKEITDTMEEIARRSPGHTILVASIALQIAFCACRMGNFDLLKSAAATKEMLDRRWTDAVRKLGVT